MKPLLDKNGMPETTLGFPVVIDPQMDSNEIRFGDLSIQVKYKQKEADDEKPW